MAPEANFRNTRRLLAPKGGFAKISRPPFQGQNGPKIAQLNNIIH